MGTRFTRSSAARTACAALFLSCAAISGPVVHAALQKPQSPGDNQAPVFKSGVDLVAIDVNVVDKTGTPVRSLNADQFLVTVDGRPRRVVSAEVVDYTPPPDQSSRGDDESAESQEGYSSNDRPWRVSRAGRLFYLLVDQGSFRAGGTTAAIAATRRFVQGLQPADRVGLVAFPGPGPSVPATADHAAVRIALGSLVAMNQPLRSAGPSELTLSESTDITAEDPNAFSAAVGRECQGLTGLQRSACADHVRQEARGIALNAEVQTRRALAAMRQVIQGLAFVEERKTLVLVSAGLPASDRTAGSFNMTSEISQVATEAAKANANLYVLHLDTSFLDAFSSTEQHLSRTVTRDVSIAGTGLDTLAGASGGTLFRIANEADYAFDRVLKETSSSYVLGVEPLEGDRDGKPHEVRINVKLPGVHVRARREFVAPPVAKTASASPVAVALASPWVATGLSVGVSTRTLSVQPTGRLRVLVSAEVGRDIPSAAEFTVGVVVKDAQGRLVVAPRPESARLVVPRGSPKNSASYVATLDLPPGDYHLRLAATDAEGRVGSVDHPFSVGLAQGEAVMMGDLVLLHPTRSADDPLALINDGRMPIGKLATHLEVLAPADDLAPTVTFGVADRVDGPLLVKAAGTVAKSSVKGQSAADGLLDLSLLPPGKYAAVAIVSLGTHTVGTRSQPLYLDRPAVSADTAVAGSVGTSGAAPRVRFAPSPSSTLVKKFAQADVVTPAALTYFANRLMEADATPPAAVASALTDLRSARFDAVLDGLSHTPSDGLSAAFVKGVALLAKGQPVPASAEFRKALRLADDFLPAAFYLGACYAAEGKDDMAVGAWQTALAAEGEARIVYDVLADALLRLEDPEQALQVLEEARGRWPDDDGFRTRQAVADAMIGRRAEALDMLERHLEQHRTDTEAAALAIRLIYEAHAAGHAITSAQEDREAAAKFGEWYHAAGGQDQALVDRWLAFIAKQ